MCMCLCICAYVYVSVSVSMFVSVSVYVCVCECVCVCDSENAETRNAAQKYLESLLTESLGPDLTVVYEADGAGSSVFIEGRAHAYSVLEDLLQNARFDEVTGSVLIYPYYTNAARVKQWIVEALSSESRGGRALMMSSIAILNALIVPVYVAAAGVLMPLMIGLVVGGGILALSLLIVPFVAALIGETAFADPLFKLLSKQSFWGGGEHGASFLLSRGIGHSVPMVFLRDNEDEDQNTAAHEQAGGPPFG